MLSLLEAGARFIRVFIELCVLVGILLLLYFLAEVVEFFPPSLTLGDAAKLALVSVVAASVHFVVVIVNLGVSSVAVLIVLFFVKWASRWMFGSALIVEKIDWYLSKVEVSGFFQLFAFGTVIIWASIFDWFPSVTYATKPWIVLACSAAFIFITASYFQSSDHFKLDKRTFLDESGELSLSVQVFAVGLLIALVAPVFAWGSFDTFVLITMTKSGLIQVPADLFIKQEYCGLVTGGFDVIDVREGFCHLKKVAVMFQGIGDKILIENFSNGYKVTLPADSVFMSSDGEAE